MKGGADSVAPLGEEEHGYDPSGSKSILEMALVKQNQDSYRAEIAFALLCQAVKPSHPPAYGKLNRNWGYSELRGEQLHIA